MSQSNRYQSRAASGNNGQMVIVNRASGTISILDAQTGQLIRTVDLPAGTALPEPMYAVSLLGTQEVAVNDRANSRVVFFDASTYDVTRTVDTGEGSFHMWADTQEKQLWVVNDIANSMSVIDLATSTTTEVPLLASIIGTDSKPHDVIVDPLGQYAYVSIIRADHLDADLILKIDIQTLDIIDSVEAGKDPHLTLAPESNLLYSPAQGNNRVDVFDIRGTALTKVDSVDLPAAHGVDFGLNGKQLYITNIAGGGPNGIFVVDTLTNEITGNLDGVDTPVPIPHNAWLSGNGDRLFITHSGGTSSQVSVYSLEDPTRPQLLDTIDVEGLNPFGLAYAAGPLDDLFVGGDGGDRFAGHQGNDIIFAGAGNDSIRGDRDDDKLFGQAGRDYLGGGSGDDVLIGGEGPDFLHGNNGDDVMIGVRVNSTTPGRGEVDWMKAGPGADVFVLGDAFGPYYDDGVAHTAGQQDTALIKDFRQQDGDVMRLHGSADQYQLQSGKGGTAIVYTGGSDHEQIALVQGVTGLSLSNSAFEYVADLG